MVFIFSYTFALISTPCFSNNFFRTDLKAPFRAEIHSVARGPFVSNVDIVKNGCLIVVCDLKGLGTFLLYVAGEWKLVNLFKQTCDLFDRSQIE